MCRAMSLTARLDMSACPSTALAGGLKPTNYVPRGTPTISVPEPAALHTASISVMLLRLVWAECFFPVAPIILELELAAQHAAAISTAHQRLVWMECISPASVTSW